MAEVIGFLRSDATQGEHLTLKLLRQNLPKEFTIYVETPLRKKRELRYPDFIILTNYGVIVVEVKDWVIIERADPHGATIRTRSGQSRFEHNPVEKAREFAIILSNELNKKRNQGQPGEAIPWSYCTVLPNLPSSVITQLRQPWGEEFVFGKADLENADLLLQRLRNTLPVLRMRSLTRSELNLVRATIYPVVEIELPDRPIVILDEQQEKIVAEPLRSEKVADIEKAQSREPERYQDALFADLLPKEQKEELPEFGERIVHNYSIRLIRGFSGSGKTLVLTQRAKFLAAQFPDWKIGVLTYNRQLRDHLESSLRGSNVQASTFHALCRRMVQVSELHRIELDGWIEENQANFPAIEELGSTLVEQEIKWIREVGVSKREVYKTIERRGQGKVGRLSVQHRDAIFDVLEAYRNHLEQNDLWDWGELPLIINRLIEAGNIQPESFDALLIDEAQDWAPAWFTVVNQVLNPDHGLLFLADDPSQSIYRHFSWKEKGVHIVGRTRWLRVPYRNTFEIYQAAYGLIDGYEEIQSALCEEGEVIKPEIASDQMRHGPTPLVRKCRNVKEEIEFTRSTIEALKQQGLRDEQIAVLVRFKKDLRPLQEVLRGTRVIISPIHGFKGLEMEAVILPHLHNTFTFSETDHEANERRLFYMAMSRARSHLYMTYSGRLPKAFESLRGQNLANFSTS